MAAALLWGAMAVAATAATAPRLLWMAASKALGAGRASRPRWCAAVAAGVLWSNRAAGWAVHVAEKERVGV